MQRCFARNGGFALRLRVCVRSALTALGWFSQEEKRKAEFNEVVAQLTEVCFDNCVSKPGNKLDSYETSCLSQCSLRYLETGQVILGRLQRMQQQ